MHQNKKPCRSTKTFPMARLAYLKHVHPLCTGKKKKKFQLSWLSLDGAYCLTSVQMWCTSKISKLRRQEYFHGSTRTGQFSRPWVSRRSQWDQMRVKVLHITNHLAAPSAQKKRLPETTAIPRLNAQPVPESRAF